MLNRNDPRGSMKLITKYCSRKRGYKRDFVRYIVTKWILHGIRTTLFPVYTVKHRLRSTWTRCTERHRNRCKTHNHFKAPLRFSSIPPLFDLFSVDIPKGEKGKKKFRQITIIDVSSSVRFPSFCLDLSTDLVVKNNTDGWPSFRPLSIIRNEKKPMKKKKQETRKSAETRVSSPAYVYDA